MELRRGSEGWKGCQIGKIVARSGMDGSKVRDARDQCDSVEEHPLIGLEFLGKTGHAECPVAFTAEILR